MVNDYISKEDAPMFTSGSRFILGAVYLKEKLDTCWATFDLYIRDLPPTRNYFVFAGLEHVIDYLLHWKLTDEHFEFLKRTYNFDDDVMEYYKNLRFTGDVAAIREGSIVFPGEPVIRITAPIIEASLIEYFLVNQTMLQTMQASKLSRIVTAGYPKMVACTFHRAHGIDAAVKGMRSAVIVGVHKMPFALAAMRYGLPPENGMTAHYFISSFPSELDAFRAYYKYFPNRAFFLVDTYNTLEGVRNTITVAKELEAIGKRARAIFIDSGDYLALSRAARAMLDHAGLQYIQIVVGGNFDEYKIDTLVRHNAPIDMYTGVTEMLTSSDHPKLEVVFKLSEFCTREGHWIPKMKTATGKHTFPGRKQVYRLMRGGRACGDILGLDGEHVPGATPLLEPIIKSGQLVHPLPSLQELRAFHTEERKRFDGELFNLHTRYAYPVTVSQQLQALTDRTRTNFTK